MRKLISIIFMLLFLLSCAVQGRFSEYIKVYKIDGPGMMTPTYLILKHRDAGYDLYSSCWQGGALGTYTIQGDTLQLTPKYEYGQTKVRDVDTLATITSIPIFFIMKDDKLIDITEYEKYPGFFPGKAYDGFYKLRLRK